MDKDWYNYFLKHWELDELEKICVELGKEGSYTGELINEDTGDSYEDTIPVKEIMKLLRDPSIVYPDELERCTRSDPYDTGWEK